MRRRLPRCYNEPAMSKAEILAELPRLSAEDLAEVRAKLDELSRPPVHAVDIHGARARMRAASPRHAERCAPRPYTSQWCVAKSCVKVTP